MDRLNEFDRSRSRYQDLYRDTNGHRYGGLLHGRPPYEDRLYGGLPYGCLPYGRPSYGGQPDKDRSLGHSSYGGQPFGSRVHRDEIILRQSF